MAMERAPKTFNAEEADNHEDVNYPHDLFLDLKCAVANEWVSFQIEKQFAVKGTLLGLPFAKN